MTTIGLDSVPQRLVEGPRSALQGMAYPELVRLADRLAAQDGRIVFDSLRPVSDELWNFIDGSRTVGEIVESVCFEFDFQLDPGEFICMFEGMERAGMIAVGQE